MELVTTAMASGGDAVARTAEGKAVFVRGALPGERVRVTFTADRARYANAAVSEIVEASPDRITPACPELAHGCGACQWQHIDLEGQRRLKRGFVIETIERSGVECPTPEEPVELAPWAFRTNINAAVVEGRAGFHRARSTETVTVDGCLVAHPLLEELLVDGRYPEATKVLLRCGARTGDRLAVTTPAGLTSEVPADVRCDHVHEEAAGRRWRISARSFFQARPDGVDALAQMVTATAEAGSSPSSVIDLYSGVGLFAGVLAARGWAVTAVEGSGSAVADARVNLEPDGVRVVHGDVTRWTPTASDVVVADPSRMGLGRDGVRVASSTGARRVILVSCDAASLGRDAALLQEAGYKLTAVSLVDLFPHTFRVEAVTVYDR